jgi:DedD protein
VENKTKQRMIGFAIIFVILLILIPLLFSSSEKPVNESPAIIAESTSTTEETSPQENADQQSATAEQPQINSDQSQLNTEQQAMPEQSTTEQQQPAVNENNAESLAPQSNYAPLDQQTTAPPTNELPSKPEESVSTPTDQTAVPKITAPIKVTKNELPSNKMSGQVKKWSVQLGTFSEKSNAVQLLNKLKGDGFEARLKELISSGSKVYRVFVGKNYDQNKAQKVAHNLEQSYHLKGIIVRNK